MKRLIVLTLTSGLAVGATLAGAQQTGGGSPTATGTEVMTIDCPPEKVKEATRAQDVPAPGSPVGTPSGTGTGSGIMARPSESKPQRWRAKSPPSSRHARSEAFTWEM